MATCWNRTCHESKLQLSLRSWNRTSSSSCSSSTKTSSYPEAPHLQLHCTHSLEKAIASKLFTRAAGQRNCRSSACHRAFKGQNLHWKMPPHTTNNLCHRAHLAPHTNRMRPCTTRNAVTAMAGSTCVDRKLRLYQNVSGRSDSKLGLLSERSVDQGGKISYMAPVGAWRHYTAFLLVLC